MKNLHKIISTFALLVLFNTMIPTVSAIGATPLKTILRAAPGETVSGSIIAQNSHEIAQQLVLKKGDFRVREDETMQFLMDKDPENEWSMQDWIKLPTEDQLPVMEPDMGAQFTYNVTVPKDAKSQSYYGTIFISSETPDTEKEGAIGISTNVAHLILLEVTGDLNTDIETKDFIVDTKQYGTAEQEVRFETLLFNSGNTHVAPSGTITIKDSNDKFVDEIFINEDSFHALPNRHKTIVERWSYAEAEPGNYKAYLNGETVDGQYFSAETAFEIQSNEEEEKVIIPGDTIINETITIETEKSEQPAGTSMLVLYILLVAVLASVIYKLGKKYLPCACKKKHHKAHKTHKRKSKKRSKKFLGLFSIMMILGSITVSNVNAQNTHTLDVTLEVENGQVASLEIVGCLTETAPDTWEFEATDTTANLNQPGDRETGVGTGDQFGWYNVHGGTPNGTSLSATTAESFGYDDCVFGVTAKYWTDWNITLYGTDFEDTLDIYEIPDMTGYNTAGFDFNIESEDPNTGGGTQYPLAEGEHGFFISGASGGMISAATDDGTAAGVSYTTPKAFDATTCGDGSARPCYHFVPDIANPHTIYDASAPNDNVDDEGFAIRFGTGVVAANGTYDMTVTLTLNTTP